MNEKMNLGEGLLPLNIGRILLNGILPLILGGTSSVNGSYGQSLGCRFLEDRQDFSPNFLLTLVLVLPSLFGKTFGAKVFPWDAFSLLFMSCIAWRCFSWWLQ